MALRKSLGNLCINSDRVVCVYVYAVLLVSVAIELIFFKEKKTKDRYNGDSAVCEYRPLRFYLGRNGEIDLKCKNKEKEDKETKKLIHIEKN